MNLENLTSKQLLALFYIFANIVSAIICGIILHKSNRNKNTRSRFYARILNFLNMYFVGDAVWALGFFDIVHGASTILIISRIIYYSSAAFIAYFWFMYVELLLESSIANNKKTMRLMFIPVIISILYITIICIFRDPSKNNLLGYSTAFSLIVVPYIYIISGGVHAYIKRNKLQDRNMKARYRNLAIWPVLIVFISVLQLFIAQFPIFCFGSTIVILGSYIYNQDALIFTDPLTGIYNRNMLNRYVSTIEQAENVYVFMIDVDYFKHINDTYGHLEGDKALKFVAKTINESIADKGYFLARYGGDEFIIISKSVDNVEEFESTIKEKMKESKSTLGYEICVSIGQANVEGSKVMTAISDADRILYKQKKIAHQRRR